MYTSYEKSQEKWYFETKSGNVGFHSSIRTWDSNPEKSETELTAIVLKKKEIKNTQ